MSLAGTAAAIAESKLIVVLRHIPLGVLDGVADALRAAGVRVLEVALNTPGALKQLELLRRFDFCLGAGTALREQAAKEAIAAGAEFLFSPIRSDFFLPLCRERSIVGIPGGLTPTEIYTLHAEGAPLIKVFPGSLGGPEYVREILAPCEDLKLVPAGGVDLLNLESYLAAGVAAVAVGTEIVSPRLAADRDFKVIARQAAQFTEKIKSFSERCTRTNATEKKSGSSGR
jgi:2-dehydro-3-deoxyphosphogluconate aldolase/(4S)-4-hydroxy-2-oxoglutarate aldolase